jgi:hypothetical protein
VWKYLAVQFDLHTQICLLETTPDDIKILGLFLHEFLLESITRGNMHHVINKLAVNGEVIALVFQENHNIFFSPAFFTFSQQMSFFRQTPSHIRQPLRSDFRQSRRFSAS